jgi:hypothetical protein
MSEPEKKDSKKEDHSWHEQQAKLLKNWAEISSSYRWLHYQAYLAYKTKNLFYMIPLIIMSTVTGTANFAQSSFPEFIRPNVPQIIGAINLISAILTTIYQFLKISEYMESHRISSINYGKLARTITVELNLPVKDRSSGGAQCVKQTRNEIDRLIEQCPSIPKNILNQYSSKFSNIGLAEPEIIVINKVDIYTDVEDKVITQVAQAGLKLKELKKTKFQHLIESMKNPVTENIQPLPSAESPISKKREHITNELKTIGASKLVSSLKSIMKKNDPPPQQYKEVFFTESIPDNEVVLTESIPDNGVVLTESIPDNGVFFTESIPDNEVVFTESIPDNEVIL